MTGSSSIVDWNALSLNEGIRLLSEVMRQYLGVRLFAVTPQGESVDLGPSISGVETVFDHFVDTDARWGDGDQRASMVETRRQWVEKLQIWQDDESATDQQSAIVETAPGFSAQIVPIFFRQELVGGLVAAGFVPAEKAVTRVEAIRAVLPHHLLEAIDDSTKEGPEIIQLPRQDRRWLGRLVSTMAGRLADELAGDASSVIDDDCQRFAGILGKSDAMRQLFEKIDKIADTDSSVLIMGENGTGKELVARGLHRLSGRREEPFVAVNCAAIPADLIASELFGHVKGSFSGAHQDREGLFEAANGGTLLLDEIGDMDQSLQTKLLRVLQEGNLVRVGGSEVRKVDVRVLCATNSDLEKLVRQDRFRRDLYFRIRVIKLSLPPLRDRRDDIGLLARHFLSAAARRHGTVDKEFGADCLRQLTQYDWPGNVRELKNEVERLAIMSGSEAVIEASWLRERVAGADEPETKMDFTGYELPEAIELIERKMIFEGLQKTGWNKAQTARDLGVSRRNLIRKVARYELEELREDN